MGLPIPKRNSCFIKKETNNISKNHEKFQTPGVCSLLLSQKGEHRQQAPTAVPTNAVPVICVSISPRVPTPSLALLCLTGWPCKLPFTGSPASWLPEVRVMGCSRRLEGPRLETPKCFTASRGVSSNGCSIPVVLAPTYTHALSLSLFLSHCFQVTKANPDVKVNSLGPFHCHR